MPARCQFLGIKFIGDYRFKFLPSIIESDKGFLKTFIPPFRNKVVTATGFEPTTT